jgi:anaerobic glycerol-3-phosphate dehydrogenase B subunit
MISDPWAQFSSLDARHPYAKMGAERVKESLSYFGALAGGLGMPMSIHDRNQSVVTPLGLLSPALGTLHGLATHADCEGKSVAIIDFEQFRDFPSRLLASGLAASARSIEVVQAALPGHVSETVAVARSFDTLQDPRGYFAAIARKLPPGTEVILFPAVLGLTRHDQTRAMAESVLGVPCREVATLPASVPGRRLEAALRRCLEARGADIISSFRPSSAKLSASAVELIDTDGRAYGARAAVLATGGVLMGGLDVQSTGVVAEPIFDLLVEQEGRILSGSISSTLEALHRAGVKTDASFNPFTRDDEVVKNVFVTGQTLSSFNPYAEGSVEGVSIATGWCAARHCQTLLEGAHT